MRRRRHERGASVLLVSMVCSAVVHLIVGFPLKSYVEQYLSGAEPTAPVRVVRVSAEQWSRNFQTNRPTARAPGATARPAPGPSPVSKPPPERAPEAKDDPPKKKEPVRPDRQVVDVPPTADDRADPNAKYLSKYNTRVEKESVARLDERDPSLKRTTNKLQRKSSPKPTEQPSIKTKGLSVQGDGLPEDLEGKKGSGQFELKLPDILKRDELKLGLGLSDDLLALHERSASEGMAGNSDRFSLRLGKPGGDPEAGEGGGKKGAKDGAKEAPPLPTLSALMPSLGSVGRVAGSPSMDHVEGVAEGDGTFLNTKEFKYATFIHRVSDTVYPYWDSYLHTEYRRRDPTRRIYGQKDRSTTIKLELDLRGEVADVSVQESSGVDFLDEVVVRAFRSAGPFPNPPAAMADEDGRIRLSYRFVVILSPSRGALFRGLR